MQGYRGHYEEHPASSLTLSLTSPSTILENSLPFSSNLKLLSANSGRVQNLLFSKELTCAVYSTVTWDLDLKSRPKDN